MIVRASPDWPPGGNLLFGSRRGDESLISSVPKVEKYETPHVVSYCSNGGSALSAKPSDETARGEMCSGAAGLDDVDLLVGFHSAGRKLAAQEQGLRQGVEALHLPGRGFALVKIPDEADAEGDLVLRLAMKMTAVELFPPAVADGDFAIAHPMAIADEEMICQPMLHMPLHLVVAVDGLQIPLVHAATTRWSAFYLSLSR